MKICGNCGHPFFDDNLNPNNPAEALGDLFQKSIGLIDDSDLCQACKVEFGMITLMGFDE